VIAALAAAEANTAEELENALAGIDIADDDNCSDMSMDQMIAEIISVASSAASMECRQLENRVWRRSC